MLTERSANLCWGQRYHWLRYLAAPAGSRHEAHITDSFPLPAGVTVTQIQLALNCLVRRHEVLRTVFALDARGLPRQHVQPPAPMPITLAVADDGTATPAEAIRGVTETDFDMGREWPIRACVVTAAGVVKRLHMVFNHVAFDDVSLGALRSDLDMMLTAVISGRPVALQPVAHQPVDLARRESALPSASTQPALEHWRDEVRRLPADVFASRRRRVPVPGAAHSASLTSPSLLQTTQDIGKRQRVWPSAVHLAAYSVTMAAYTGEKCTAHRMYTSQREASGYPSVVTCMSYPTMVRIDLSDDPPFSEVLRRATARVEQSLAHAHVPYDEIAELVACESTRRGQPVRLASELNFLSQAPKSCGTRRDRLTPNPAPADWARAGSDTYFRIYEWSDGVTLVLQAMAAVMRREDVERWLRGYARLLAAHRDPAVDLRVSQVAGLLGFAPDASRRIVRVGPDAVDVDETEAVLCGHAAVDSAQLSVVDRGLVANVVVKGSVTAAALRRHVLGAMFEHAAVRCPDWFRLVDIEGLAPTLAGDGLDHDVLLAGTAAERALATAVSQVNGVGRLNLADSYPASGGRALRSPRVVEALRESGWAGISIGQLGTARPLSALAGLLERA